MTQSRDNDSDSDEDNDDDDDDDSVKQFRCCDNDRDAGAADRRRTRDIAHSIKLAQRIMDTRTNTNTVMERVFWSRVVTNGKTWLVVGWGLVCGILSCCRCRLLCW